MLTEAQADKVVHRLLGTADSVAHVLEVLGIDADEGDVLDQLADDIEKCQGCEWWFPPSELDSEPEPGYCDECNKDERDTDA